MSWWARWRARQAELAQGADADLVRDNQRKALLSQGFYLLAVLWFLVLAVLAKFQSWGALSKIVAVLAMVFLVAGRVVGRWARAESAFLNRPGPEKLPSIFKE